MSVRYREEQADAAFAMNLRLVCGGYAYTSILTEWIAFSDQFEVRKPRCYQRGSITRDIRAMTERLPFWVDTGKAKNVWLKKLGWALIPLNYARARMPQWLMAQTCVRTAFDSFVDKNITSPRALKRQPTKGARLRIKERDNHRCLLCGGEDGLTLDHFMPYSTGGETTSQNLVTLCAKCNSEKGASTQGVVPPEIADAWRIDTSLVTQPYTVEKLLLAKQHASDIMHTRCEIA
jgi:hypothetical protein